MAKKKQKIDKDKVLTAVLLLMLGAAISMVICTLIAAHQPTTHIGCNDGWQIENRGDEIIKTYVEENDTCKKGLR